MPVIALTESDESEVEAFRKLADNLLTLSPLEVAAADAESAPTDRRRVVGGGADRIGVRVDPAGC